MCPLGSGGLFKTPSRRRQISLSFPGEKDTFRRLLSPLGSWGFFKISLWWEKTSVCLSPPTDQRKDKSHLSPLGGTRAWGRVQNPKMYVSLGFWGIFQDSLWWKGTIDPSLHRGRNVLASPTTGLRSAQRLIGPERSEKTTKRTCAGRSGRFQTRPDTQSSCFTLSY